MSNELALAAVTTALRNYLVDAVKIENAPPSLNLQKGLEITTLPLHKVREKFTFENVVNLLLYRVDLNAAWRNQALPSQSRPGESGQPPLALDLDYLVTAFGEDEREDVAQFILGQAMRFLHDFPFIPRARLELALPEAKVHHQIERVKVTPHALSVDELSKLWTVFQTQYRLSAAYVASVVLIDNRVAVRSPLPVLTRGKDDRGFDAVAGAPPSLASARAATLFGAVELGEELIVDGQRLDLPGLSARVRHPLLAAPVPLSVTPVNATQVRVALPPPGGGAARQWVAGVYSLSLVLSIPDRPDYATNEVPFALAPAITVTSDAPPPHAGTIALTIEATPQVREEQSVLVVWDGTQVAPASVQTGGGADDPTVVKFSVKTDAGTHRVRLRVDGIDSIVMKETAGGYEFDPAQSVEVLP